MRNHSSNQYKKQIGQNSTINGGNKMKNKLMLMLAMLLAAVLVLGACGSSDDDTSGDDNNDQGTEEPAEDEGTEDEGTNEDAGSDFSVAMVTDEGGVDDRSFNQSAWEGIEAFGEENGLERGTGFDYAQSENAADFLPNFNSLVNQGYNLIFGVGYQLKNAVTEVALQNPETHFSIIDDVVEADNVASVTFAEEEGSFLAGVAAAYKTETNKVGFIGGVTSPLIKRFETGFVAGVKSVNPDIEVQIQYAESFSDEGMGRSIANNMYSSGADVIYHASGAVGLGVFTEARNRVENDPDSAVWVIGVDRDQYEQGQQGDRNVTLTSMVKRVDIAVQEVATRAMNGEFPGGEHLILGIDDGAISIADTNAEAYTQEIADAVAEWQEKLVNGDVVAPNTDEALAEFLNNL